MTTFDEMFSNPTPDVAEAVAQERAAGLEELELLAGGFMSLRGEQPDSSALPDAGALRVDVPLSEAERSEA